MTERGISCVEVEVVPWAPPAFDQPIMPLAQATPEVPLSLYGGDTDARRDTERRRKVDGVLAKAGLRPSPW